MKYTRKQIHDYYKNGDISDTTKDDLLYILDTEEGLI